MTMPKEVRIQQLKNRVDLLRGRGEELNSKLINKALRQIRKLEREEQEQ
jgi:hypothetical protein